MTHRKAGRFAHALAGILCGCVIAGSSLTRVYAQELPDQTQNTPANGSRLTWTAPQGQQNTPLTLVALQKRLEQAQQELRVLQARRHYILKTMQRIEQRMLTRTQRSNKRSIFSEKRIRPSA
ncbi:hypothetical protein HUU40_17050 [candidate division KSB1 bacterium]|nr:hypothetical protein [candidate division KSB1 bacterium]